MPDRLHWNTVKPILKEVLTILMHEKQFTPFRLVGGTSLSLQLGHRMSDDIDLFTDDPYDSFNFANERSPGFVPGGTSTGKIGVNV